MRAITHCHGTTLLLLLRVGAAVRIASCSAEHNDVNSTCNRRHAIGVQHGLLNCSCKCALLTLLPMPSHSGRDWLATEVTCGLWSSSVSSEGCSVGGPNRLQSYNITITSCRTIIYATFRVRQTMPGSTLAIQPTSKHLEIAATSH